MSFREKSAWISFGSILLVYAVYFSRVAATVFGDADGRGAFHWFLATVISLVVLEVVLHILVAILSPHEAKTPKDERERLIELKAAATAFPVLVGGALCAIGTMHLGVGVWTMGNAVLLAIVVAELVRFGAEIIHHRRHA